MQSQVGSGIAPRSCTVSDVLLLHLSRLSKACRPQLLGWSRRKRAHPHTSASRQMTTECRDLGPLGAISRLRTNACQRFADAPNTP